jgi:hypothetical protein
MSVSESLTPQARAASSPPVRGGRATTARVRLSSLGWLAHAALTLDEWRVSGVRLGAAGRSTNWWIGDWVRYGVSRYGQKYDLACEITGYDDQTLMNFAYVAGRFEISRRREELSWSHHAELAPLLEEAQERWLDRAAAQRLTVRELRALVRPSRGNRAPASSAGVGVETPGGESSVACPSCGFAFRITGAAAAGTASTAAGSPVSHTAGVDDRAGAERL